MSFIYHGVPEQMAGSIIEPLNQMRTNNPELYEKYAQKYKGREELMKRRVPVLDCLWNDVVQFLPFHPRKVFELQKALGLIDEIPDYRYFQIDTDVLNPEKLAVYFKTAPGEENAHVEMFNDVDPTEIQEVPPATVAYFKTLIGTGEQPFNYQFVPHVLYQGEVDISNAPVIEL
jgi:hypothetical protein